MNAHKYTTASPSEGVYILHFNFPVEDDLTEGMRDIWDEDSRPNLLSWIGSRDGVEVLSHTRYSMTFTMALFFDEAATLDCIRSIIEGLGFVLSPIG